MSFFERLKTEASAEWHAYTEHPFTAGLADASLPEAAFRHYLVQDYLFLIEFARAYALSVYKSPTLADMREAAGGIAAILDVEMNLHIKLSAGWGLSATDLEQAPPAVEMLAYTRYVLDAGMRGDRSAARRATRRARGSEPVSRLDRRVCRSPLSGGRSESAGAFGNPCRSLRHAGARGGTGRNLQGSHPARSRLLGNGLARGQTLNRHWPPIRPALPPASRRQAPPSVPPPFPAPSARASAAARRSGGWSCPKPKSPPAARRSRYRRRRRCSAGPCRPPRRRWQNPGDVFFRVP